MAFVKTHGYFQCSITAIVKGIRGTEQALAMHLAAGVSGKIIGAHESQIESYQKNLAARRLAYENWKKINRGPSLKGGTRHGRKNVFKGHKPG